MYSDYYIDGEPVVAFKEQWYLRINILPQNNGGHCTVSLSANI